MRRRTLQEHSDGELIAAARAGDANSYALLWQRHRDAARSAARALARSRADADDIVSEAFARVLRVLQRGGGPDLSFRPYLLTAVRNVFFDRARRAREDTTDELEDTVNVSLLDSMELHEDREFVGRAFASLPERWQLVLWHTEVEGRTPGEVAPLLGLAPNAVAALAYRAREGLRQAFLQEHLQLRRPPECQEVIAQLGAYVRDGLSLRARAAIDDHLDTCESCPLLLAELIAENTALRAVLIPAVIGVPAAAYLSGLRGGGIVTRLLRAPKGTQAAVVGAAAVMAVAVGSAVASSNNGGELVFHKATAAQLATGLSPAPLDRGRPPATSPVAVPHSPATAGTVPPANDTPPPTGTDVAVPIITFPPTMTTTGATTSPTTRPTARPTSTAATTASSSTTVSTSSSTTVAPAYSFAVSYEVAVHIGSPPAASGLRNLLLSEPAPLSRYASVAMHLTNTSSLSADSVRVRFFVQAPATWIGANPTGWACTQSDEVVTCAATGPLAAGESSTLDLAFGAVPTSGFTLTPTLESPAGATVSGQTSVVIPATSTTDAFAAFMLHGGATVVVSPPQACTAPCDTAASGTPPPVLQFTGTVQGAYVVWWAPGTLPAAMPGAHVTVGGNGGDVTASLARSADTTGYVAYADVTTLVTAPGEVTVSGSQAISGWVLVVVAADAAGPHRIIRIDTPAIPAHDNSEGLKDQFEAFVVRHSPPLAYTGQFNAGALSMVAFANGDDRESVAFGTADPVPNPFTADPGLYTPAAYDGSSITVSTDGDPFVLALVVSSAEAPQ